MPGYGTSVLCLDIVCEANSASKKNKCSGPLNSSISSLSFFIILILVLGVFQLGIPYIFYTTAIKHVTALDAIIFPIIEPILNPILVFFILGETLGPWAFLGGVLVLGGVIVRGVLKTDH